MNSSTFFSENIAKLFFKEMGSFPVLKKEEEKKKLSEIHSYKIKVIILLINNQLFLNWIKERYFSRKSTKKKKHQLFVLLERYSRNKHFDYTKIIDLFIEYSINISYFFESNEWKLILRCVEIYDLSKKEGKLFHIPKQEIDDLKYLIDNVRKLQGLIKTFENHNIRLLISIANKLHRNVEILEKVQYGAFGLRIAVYMYNINSGFMFSTYATCWISQSIRRNISNFQATIRIPVHVVDDVSKLLKFYETFPEITDENEIVKRLEWTKTHYNGIKKSLPTFNVQSIDELNEDNDNNYNQAIDIESPSPEESFESQELKELLFELMKNNLTKRERDVISLRFGLDGKGGKTLEEIGRHYSLSRERVRQIESGALKILKFQLQQHDLNLDNLSP